MTIIDFKDYIKRKLGYPLHSIELTDEQIFDCITEAVQRFTERHYDSVIRNLYKLQLLPNRTSYDLPINIKTVIDVIPTNALAGSLDTLERYSAPISSMGYYDYLFQVTDVTDITTRRYAIGLSTEVFRNLNIRFDFNYSMHRLNIIGDVSNLIRKYSNEYVYLLVYECPMEELDDLYDNRWLKQYSVALCKKQWSTNLKKYNGAALPGGAEINHEGIMSDAKEELEKLEIELEDEFVLPPKFIVG